MALTQVASGLIASVAGSTITGSQSIPKSTLPTGSVLQVVQATYSTQASTTSSTYADTGLSASITPSSATSKILVMGTMPMRRGAGNVWGGALRIVRNSTAVSTVMTNIFYSNTLSTADLSNVSPFNYLDSPATTSATTYKIQFNSSNGAGIYVQIDNDTSVITLMEIAA